MNYPETMRNIKTAAGAMTQREFSKLIGVSDSCVSYVLNGKRTPSLAMAQKFAKGLGLNLEKFLALIEKKRK